MTGADLVYTPAVELAALIRAGEVSPVEVVRAVLARIEAVDPALNACATVTADTALAEARAAERAVARGEPLPLLHGVPFTAKDMLDTKGVRTTFGSYIFERNTPADDAVSVARMKAAGGILIGKTTTSELGHKGTTDSPLHGVTRNPWRLDRTSGGSSGGAAAAAAAGMAPLALGTDAGGSIRIPAACCGVVGLKATRGAIPHAQPPDLFGGISHVGPMTRTVADAALAFGVLAGPDRRDPASYGAPAGRDYLPAARATGSLRGLRVGWAATVGNPDVDREVRALCESAVRVLEGLSAAVLPLDLDLRASVESVVVLFPALQCAAYGRHLEAFGDRMDPSLRESIAFGRTLTAEQVEKAMFVRTDIYRQVQALFDRIDLLVTPTLAAPAIPATSKARDPVAINGKVLPPAPASWFPYTHPFNLAGNPAVSVPCGWTTEGLPVGLQLAGPWYGEERLFRAAAELEAARPWAGRRPPLEPTSPRGAATPGGYPPA